MKTMTPLKLITFLCLFFFVASIQGQTLKGVLKKKTNKAIDNAAKTLEGKDKKDSNSNEDVQVVNHDEKGRSAPIKNYIDSGSTVFVDDFDRERPAEFPSRWTQIKGALETNQIMVGDKKDGVLETISNYITIKPTIKGDNYLGDQFKIEMRVYFNNKGNEAYYVNLKNSADGHRNHNMRISPNAMWSGSDNISRMPGHPKAGWVTFQISFNKGHVKAHYNGTMLVNDTNITTHEEHPKDSFTHLEVEIISPSTNSVVPLRQRVTYFAIGGKGHNLYERLSSDEGIVEHINFNNNSYVIQKSSYPALDKIAKMLLANSGANITIEGHTDANGTNESNRALGQKRADALKNYLKERNVEGGRMITLSYGEEKPADRGNTEEAFALNRRVVFRTQR